jgi:hypothetical protein
MELGPGQVPVEDTPYMMVEGQPAPAPDDTPYMLVEGQPAQVEAVYMTVNPDDAGVEEDAVYLAVDPNLLSVRPGEADEVYMMVDAGQMSAEPSMMGEATGLALFDDAMSMVEADMKATARHFVGCKPGSTLSPEEIQRIQDARRRPQPAKQETDALWKLQQHQRDTEKRRRDFMFGKKKEQEAADKQRDAFLNQQRSLSIKIKQGDRLKQGREAVDGNYLAMAPPKNGGGPSRHQSGRALPPPPTAGPGATASDLARQEYLAQQRQASVQMRSPPPTTNICRGGGNRMSMSDEMRLQHLAEEARRRADDPIVPGQAYNVTVDSREEAEAMLRMTSMHEGVYLVRTKSAAQLSTGSMRLKPGQARPSISWALSYVTKIGTISHQLALQERQGGVLSIGGKDIGRCTSIDMLVDHLQNVPGYMLSNAVFQAQLWFHGPIARQEAEIQLARMSLPGMFLVRKSLRDADYVVSVVAANGQPAHHKVACNSGAWFLVKLPHLQYQNLVDLLRANKTPEGLQLARPCGYKKKGLNRHR